MNNIENWNLITKEKNKLVEQGGLIKSGCFFEYRQKKQRIHDERGIELTFEEWRVIAEILKRERENPNEAKEKEEDILIRIFENSSFEMLFIYEHEDKIFCK
jgi:hypothetical protein